MRQVKEAMRETRNMWNCREKRCELLGAWKCNNCNCEMGSGVSNINGYTVTAETFENKGAISLIGGQKVLRVGAPLSQEQMMNSTLTYTLKNGEEVVSNEYDEDTEQGYIGYMNGPFMSFLTDINLEELSGGELHGVFEKGLYIMFRPNENVVSMRIDF